MEKLYYGAVKILKGRYKGRIGYYDNEDDDGERAIVYLGEPFNSPYFIIAHKYLKNVTDINHEKWKKENLALVNELGIN